MVKSLYITSFLIGPILNLYMFEHRGVVDIIGFTLFLAYLIYEKVVYENDLWLLFFLGFSLGFLFEFIGVKYGIPFGKYEYILLQSTTILSVPIPVAIAWGIYIVVTYQVCKYFLNKFYIESDFLTYIVTPLLMVNIDITIDPLMVDLGLWKWVDDIPIKLLGIPITNFIGWYVVSLLILITYLNMHKSNKTDVVARPLGIVFPLSYILIFLSPLIEAIKKDVSIFPFYISLTLYFLLVLFLYSSPV